MTSAPELHGDVRAQTARDRAIDRLRPVLRPVYRAWKRAEGRLVLPIPSKVRYALARARGAPSRTVLFYPGYPNAHHVIYKLVHALGWRMSRSPFAAYDLAIVWRVTDKEEVQLPPPGTSNHGVVLNAGCNDISKERVDAAAAAAFGYDIRVDPRSYSGPCVRKSNGNALHDGRIVICPVSALEPGYVYQRLVDNVIGRGTVQDIRLPVFGDVVPFAYCKYRPISDRFSNINVRVEVTSVAEVCSHDELGRFIRFCRAIGLDYGEVDVLRDRSDGKLYVVDANPTPYGPPNHLAKGDSTRALARLGSAFSDAFVAGIRGS